MDRLRYPPPGTAPATLIVPPEYQGRKPVICSAEYDAHSIQERKIDTIDELLPCLDNEKISWINIGGLGDPEFFNSWDCTFEFIRWLWKISSILGSDRRWTSTIGSSSSCSTWGTKTKKKRSFSNRSSIVLAEKFVITVQEIRAMKKTGRCINPVRQRLREGVGNARFMKADYLAYAAD